MLTPQSRVTIFLNSGFVELLGFIGCTKMHILGVPKNPTIGSVQLSDKP